MSTRSAWSDYGDIVALDAKLAEYFEERRRLMLALTVGSEEAAIMIDRDTLKNTAVQSGSLENREKHGSLGAVPDDNPRTCQRCGAPAVALEAFQRVVNPDTQAETVERLCRTCFEGEP